MNRTVERRGLAYAAAVVDRLHADLFTATVDAPSGSELLKTRR